jgi:hypothetical protein
MQKTDWKSKPQSVTFLKSDLELTLSKLALYSFSKNSQAEHEM